MPHHLWSIVAVAFLALGCAGEASIRSGTPAAQGDGAIVASSDAGVAKTLGTYRGCGDRRYLSRNGCGDEQSASTYYAQTGATALTRTQWEQRTFGGAAETCLREDGKPGAQGCAKLVSAFYRNAAEIGAWSELVCTATVGRESGGCLARYFANEDDRDRGIAPQSTLAMDVDKAGRARFYSFAQDGTLSTTAAHDKEGDKHLPDSCTTCHGGSYDGITSQVGGVFRELTPEYLVASSKQALDQALQDFYTLNRAIQSANLALAAPAATRAAAFIDELYATAATTPRTAAELVPQSWQTGAPQLAQAKRELYTRVVAPYCAGCHRAGKLDFSDYEVFAPLANSVGNKSLLRRSLEGDGLAVMPQSQHLADSLAANTAAQSAIDAWLAVAPAQAADAQAPLSLLRVQSAPAAGSITLAAVTSDNAGVSQVRLLLDGQLLLEQRYDAADLTRAEVFEIKLADPGKALLGAKLEVEAIDAANNRSVASVTIGASTSAAASDGGANASDAGASDSGAGNTPINTQPPAQPQQPAAQPQPEQPEYGYTCSAAGGRARAPWFSAALLLALLVLSRLRRRAAPVLAAIVALVGTAGAAHAKKNGVAGHSGRIAGLTCATAACHSDAVAVQDIKITGANTANVGELVTLTLEVTDAPSTATGVGIAASGGALKPDAASGLSLLGAELVHGQPGSTSTWKLGFSADTEGSYTIYAAAVLGDGDDGAGGDRFGTTTFKINVGAAATPPPAAGTGTGTGTGAGTGAGTGTGAAPKAGPGPDDDEIVYGGCQAAPELRWPGAGALLVLLLIGFVLASRRRARAAAIVTASVAALLASSSAEAARPVVALSVKGSDSARLATMVKRYLSARYLVIKRGTLRQLCAERGLSSARCRRRFNVLASVRCRVDDGQLMITVRDIDAQPTLGVHVNWSAGDFYSRATRAMRAVRRGVARARRLYVLSKPTPGSVASPRVDARPRRRTRRGHRARRGQRARRVVVSMQSWSFEPVAVTRPGRRHRRRAHQQPRSRRRQIAQRSAPQPRALDRAPIDRDLTSPAPLSFPATKYASRRSTANGSPVAPIAPPPALADGAAKAKVASSDNASTPATADTPAAQVKRSVTPPARTRDLLAISLALGFASRRLTFARADAPNGRYEGAPYPEVTAGLTAFPLGLVTNGAFRNLGLALRYSQDVSASSKTGNASKDLATGSRELLIDLTLRWTFHLGRMPVHFRGAVGWGMRDFTIDENDAITTMKYRFARFSAGVRVPLGTPLLCLGLAADVRTIYSVGDEALLSLGTRTGGATAFAIRPGVSGATKMGIFYFAHFEYLELGATFIGVEQGTAREKSADSESTTQSTDRFMRFWIGGGYAF